VTCKTCEHWIPSHVHEGLGICAHRGSDPAPPWVMPTTVAKTKTVALLAREVAERRPLYVPPDFTCEDYERRRPKQWEMA
jgi:hypothetical protein